MATKTSVAKKSSPLNKRMTRRAPPSGEPQVNSSELTRESRFSAEGARSLPLDSPPSLAARVQAQRDQLFKAMSIVECCKFATATLLAVDDSEYMIPAFDAICDLIDASTEELEKIASECAKAA